MQVHYQHHRSLPIPYTCIYKLFRCVQKYTKKISTMKEQFHLPHTSIFIAFSYIYINNILNVQLFLLALHVHVPGSLNFLYNSWIIVAIFPFCHHTRICKTFCKLVKSNAISCMMNAHLLYLVHIPVHVLLHVYVS